jgi:hypothetical protein
MSVLLSARRRVIRSPVNPIDKSTVVSIFPKEIDEIKHTSIPGRFIIPPGTFEKPSVLVVGPSSWFREIDDDQPILEIPESSVVMADAIVNDYCNSYVAFTRGNASPGLFWVPGAYTIDGIKKEFQTQLNEANRKQRNWYASLIKLGDSLWARSNGNPQVIGDDMRLAAKELAQTNKDWMVDHQMVEMSRCPSCGSLVNPIYPICATCRAVVNPNRAKELGLEFVKQ